MEPFSQRETAAGETCARHATSAIVGLFGNEKLQLKRFTKTFYKIPRLSRLSRHAVMLTALFLERQQKDCAGAVSNLRAYGLKRCSGNPAERKSSSNSADSAPNRSPFRFQIAYDSEMKSPAIAG
jgi:hypothetical protein